MLFQSIRRRGNSIGCLFHPQVSLLVAGAKSYRIVQLSYSISGNMSQLL